MAKHPGLILFEEFMTHLAITANRLAKGTGVNRSTIGRLIAGDQRLTPEMAMWIRQTRLANRQRQSTCRSNSRRSAGYRRYSIRSSATHLAVSGLGSAATHAATNSAA